MISSWYTYNRASNRQALLDHSTHLWSESPAGIYFSVLNRLHEDDVRLMHTRDMRDWTKRKHKNICRHRLFLLYRGWCPTHDLRTMEESKRQQWFNSNYRFMLLQSIKHTATKHPAEKLFLSYLSNMSKACHICYMNA